MKGEITAIRQVLNDDATVNCYEIVIDVIERPDEFAEMKRQYEMIK